MQAITKPGTHHAAAYPNAADRHYFLEKLTDGILSAAICIGVVTILFFLVTMF